MEPSLEELVKRWLHRDQDESTRKEIQELVTHKNVEELEKRLRYRISFGTAGLRSSMKAGFAHMNSVTVLEASQGMAQYILDTYRASGSESERTSIVLGHDARYNSEKFARLAAAAFLAKGFEVLWLSLVHTPMVPFAVGHYGAAAGVMITASHNPKNDNGYKVYWSNGCQIIPPQDAGISKAIDAEAVQPILTRDSTQVDHNPLVKHIFEETQKEYFKSIRKLVSPLSQHPVVRFMYTPMHGVGHHYMEHAAEILGLDSSSMQVVLSQAEPDPEFTTVPFPNPEEGGALDLAKAEAERKGCSLILANDPDADRFAVAERLENGNWHQFTGNQVGVLLASYVLETHEGNRSTLMMLASTVSSRMLASMAEKEGFHFRETLTGFKWLGNVAQSLQEEGFMPAFAYEEAIGYMFPTVVWDKDGIAAAAVFLKACMHWSEQKLTPAKKLQVLYNTYGYFEDANTYLITPSPSVTNAIFTDIRKLNNGTRPTAVGGHEITRWRDLTVGYDSNTADNRPNLHIDSSAQMITCELGGLGTVVFTVRGSGTEPKIKIYIEAKAESSDDAKALANEVLQALLVEWFGPEYHGLKLAS